MARYGFKLPDVGEGTAEAEIANWHVKVGDRVVEDQNLVDMTTDKATVEIPSPVAGVILSLNGEPGDKIAVGSEIVVIETDAGEVAPAKTSVPPAKASPPPPAPKEVKPATPPAPKPTPKPAAPAPAQGGSKSLASPAVRDRARKLGIDLGSIRGTGASGQVTHDDLDGMRAPAAKASGPQWTPPPPLAEREGIEEIKIIGIRRKIAEKMIEAKRRIPHYAYVEEIDVTNLEELREYLNGRRVEGQPKLTVLPFLIRALVVAIADFPQVNARYDDDAGILRRYAPVHMGVATQTPKGLLVPVMFHAEAKGVWACATEIQRLSQTARDGSIARAELMDSTITISSLGKLGGVVSTPVINHPEVAIIAVNKIEDRVVARNGQMVIRKMMNLSSSFDHRVVDGWDAASFIQRVKELIEQPSTLFVV